MTHMEKSVGPLLKADALGRVKTPADRREQLVEEFERSGLSGSKFAQISGCINSDTTVSDIETFVARPFRCACIVVNRFNRGRTEEHRSGFQYQVGQFFMAAGAGVPQGWERRGRSGGTLINLPKGFRANARTKEPLWHKNHYPCVRSKKSSD